MTPRLRSRLASTLTLALLATALAAACESEPLDTPTDTPPEGAAGSEPAGGGAPSADAGAPAASGASGEAGASSAPLGTPILERVSLSSSEASTFHQTAFAPMDFGTEPVSRATLHVQLESPCFPFEGWKTQTTSPGHFWPDACDAFDRHFLISMDGEDGGVGNGKAPGFELTRAITPFGGPLAFDTDITDLVNGLPGEHTLRVEIPTYGDPEGKVTGSAGSWIVSASLLLEPGPAPREVLAAIPLVYSPQTSATPEPFTFETPEGTTSARIEYRATGHGQASASLPACIGPAEEFCRRTHTLSVDDAKVAEFDPWRTDCATLCTLTQNDSGNGIKQYCAENPCGAIQSVRASRANWCPGSVTPPFVVEDASLATPGEHQFSLAVDTLAEGGNWLISATFFAYK